MGGKDEVLGFEDLDDVDLNEGRARERGIVSHHAKSLADTVAIPHRLLSLPFRWS